MKNAVPASKSNANRINAPANTGVLMRISKEVAIIAQQNKGILVSGILGTRSLRIVTKKYGPPKKEAVHPTKMLKIQMPSPSAPVVRLSGG